MANVRSWRRSTATHRTEPFGPSPSLDEEIARVAYEFYERRGGIDGRDWEDWFEAERLVKERQRATAQSTR